MKRFILKIWSISIITAAFFIIPAISNSATIKGTVYEDLNGNHILDPGESGIPDVPVSNSHEVILTDKNGKYKLDIKPGQVLFVTQPYGYRIPVNEVNLPQIYYVYNPEGSDKDTEWSYEPLPPTGKIPESVDFGLIPWTHPKKFKAIVMADPQPRNDREIDFIRDDVVADMVGSEAELAIVLGDIMFDDLSLFDRQNRIFSTIGVPVWNVPGNHDINFQAKDDSESLETFKRIFGPTYYSANYGEVHFVTLKNTHYKGREESGYKGFIDETQLEWLENDLQYVPGENLIVISTHIPVKAFGSDNEAVNTVNRDKLFKLLEGRNYILLLAGHTHTNDHVYIGEEDGWHGKNHIHQHIVATVSGTWWQGPLDERGIPIATLREGGENGYHLFTFDGNTYSSRLVPASKPEDFQMRIMIIDEHHAPSHSGLVYNMMGEQGSHIRQEALHATRVLVNFFSGGEKDRITMRVDDGDPVEMEQVIRKDPYFQELKARQEREDNPNEMSFWGDLESSHIWEARLPTDLKPGVHVIHAHVLDQYGQVFEDSRIFEVSAP